MKSYPSINKHIRSDLYIYAFDKLDGSNIRAEWNSKKGFYKFGSRTELIDINSKPFGQAIPLLKDKFEKDLSVIFEKQGWKNTICFFEYWGKDSFAGTHNFEKDMDLTLLDVNPYKEGFLAPDKFIEYFGDLDIAKLLYEGYVSTELFDQVKQSTLPNMTYEGVVCKAMDNKVHTMFKIKSQAWLDKLKEYCNGNEALFAKLA
jgi:hypothetical protein